MSETETPADAAGRGRRAAARWTAFVLALTASFVLLVGGAMAALERQGRLVSPPLSATDCLDEKIALVRATNLSELTLIGVGSSSTWRNLVVGEFEQAMPGARGFNAALCLLRINQTAFWTDLVLERTPRVEAVVMTVAPRDFEECDPADTEIFNPTLGRLYLDHTLPGWVMHAINFRWSYVLREAAQIKEQRQPKTMETIVSDVKGTSPLWVHNPWMPEPSFDQRCFASLRRLDERVTAAGARLVVAATPVMPEWRRRFDPDGAITRSWIARMRRELGPEAVFIDGTTLAWPDEVFADPVHLYPEHARLFSRFVARRAAPELQRRS